MSVLTDSKSLTDLASAASQYGPFFFAVTFVFLIPVIGHRWFTSMLHDKEISAQDRRGAIGLHRLYFVSGVAMGLALVMFSVMWWVFVEFEYVIPRQNAEFIDNQVSKRLYSVKIANVAPDDFISGTSDNPLYDVYADHNPFEPVHAVVVFRKAPPVGTQVSLDYRDRETLASAMSIGSALPWSLTFPTGQCSQFMLMRVAGKPTLKPTC